MQDSKRNNFSSQKFPVDIRRITETYNKVINFLTYNFSKEQCTLPEDDLRIETCRSVLNVLV